MEYQRRLRDLREDHDKTQQEIADVLGTSQTMYARYERGANELPVRHLIKLAEYYHVSTDYLLKGIEPTGNVENNINGSLSNSPFIQANHGGVVYNGDSTISPEALELLRIYENLSGRSRLKLLNFAVELEGGKD